MNGAATVALGTAQLDLLAARAAWWSAERTLFVADLHWGKDASFRARGLPIPAGDLDAELDRLAALTARHGAARIVVLGDLIHDRPGVTPRVVDTVATWRAAVLPEVAITLVRGNHDRHLPQLPAAWRIDTVAEPFTLAGLHCVHEPAAAGDAPTLAGHLHPTVRLRTGGDGLRLPCFHLAGRVLTLPAFGSFTNGVIVAPAPGDRVFAIADDTVVELGAAQRRPGRTDARSTAD